MIKSFPSFGDSQSVEATNEAFQRGVEWYYSLPRHRNILDLLIAERTVDPLIGGIESLEMNRAIHDMVSAFEDKKPDIVESLVQRLHSNLQRCSEFDLPQSETDLMKRILGFRNACQASLVSAVPAGLRIESFLLSNCSFALDRPIFSIRVEGKLTSIPTIAHGRWRSEDLLKNRLKQLHLPYIFAHSCPSLSYPAFVQIKELPKDRNR